MMFLAKAPLVTGVNRYAVTLLLTVGTSMTIIAMPAAHATAPTPRYASPAGTTADSCNAGDPCNIEKAINDAPAGIDVTIEPGSYTTATKLQDDLGTLHIHGAAGSPAPVIHSSFDTYALYLANGSTISDVAVIASAAGTALFDIGGAADHVRVINTADFGIACSVYLSSLTDSLCLATGASGVAFEVTSSAAAPDSPASTIRGVTAVASAPSGVGIYNQAGSFTTQTVTVKNSIVHGGTTDIEVGSNNATGDAVVTLRHSDFANHTTDAGPGAASVTGDSSDTDAPPAFRNPTANDYRVAAGSPTINHGLKDPVSDLDLEGRPRTLGPRPDMGAYELPQKPAAHPLKLIKHTATTVRMTSKINAEGLPTTVTLIAVHHGKRIVATAKSAGHSTTVKTVTLRLLGLKRHTAYRVHVVATNAAGKASGPARTVKTRKVASRKL